FFGAGQHAARVGAELRFGQAKAAELCALLHCGQPFLLLLFRAERKNGIHHQRGLNADEAAHARIAALQLLHDHAVFHIRHLGARWVTRLTDSRRLEPWLPTETRNSSRRLTSGLLLRKRSWWPMIRASARFANCCWKVPECWLRTSVNWIQRSPP